MKSYYTGEHLDKDGLEYIKWFAQDYGGEFCRRVVSRYGPDSGRCIVLLNEGIPLIDLREEVVAAAGEGWRFRAWCQGAPVPTSSTGEPLSLGGRIRWYRPNTNSIWPDDSWRAMVRGFTSERSGRVGLFHEFFGRESDTYFPEEYPGAPPFTVVRFGSELFHLVSASSTDDEVARAWEEATELGGEGLGHLTSLPAGVLLSPGQEVTEDHFEQLVTNTVATAVQAFDGTGVLIWLHGVQTFPSWVGQTKHDLVEPGR